ncbi:MAG TPA: Gfo/Idh/MocA family oxidoreductase [Armatimonadetes bacterium]|nr:Gfo/Idh/MocA family oxidoreductase [Armatimonadota bacterium]
MNTTPPVRFGIVGLGVGRSRARMVKETAGAELVCVCDLREEVARTFAEEQNCAWTTDYEELLAREDVDAVGIFTPSGTHADLALPAVEAGKHTFVTKPMDLVVEKCDRLIAAAEQAGVVLAVDFGSRYNPLNHQIRQVVQSGRLGRIFLGDLRMKWYREQSYYEGGWPPGWRSRRETEGGSMANQGVHYVDLLQWFLGPVEAVFGRCAHVAHDIETEDLTQALLNFASGAWGCVQTTTANYPSLGSVIEISGHQGTLVWQDNKLARYEVKGEEKVSLDEFPPDPNLPRNIIEDVVRAVTQGTPVQVDGPEGRKSVAIVAAVYESARRGKWVRV